MVILGDDLRLANIRKIVGVGINCVKFGADWVKDYRTLFSRQLLPHLFPAPQTLSFS